MFCCVRPNFTKPCAVGPDVRTKGAMDGTTSIPFLQWMGVPVQRETHPLANRRVRHVKNRARSCARFDAVGPDWAGLRTEIC